MTVTFLTTEDGDKLIITMDKLQAEIDKLNSTVRDMNYYVHSEFNPIMEKLQARLKYLDSADEENLYLKSKKYKDSIIKEYTNSLVTAQKKS